MADVHRIYGNPEDETDDSIPVLECTCGNVFWVFEMPDMEDEETWRWVCAKCGQIQELVVEYE